MSWAISAAFLALATAQDVSFTFEDVPLTLDTATDVSLSSTDAQTTSDDVTMQYYSTTPVQTFTVTKTSEPVVTVPAYTSYVYDTAPYFTLGTEQSTVTPPPFQFPGLMPTLNLPPGWADAPMPAGYATPSPIDMSMTAFPPFPSVTTETDTETLWQTWVVYNTETQILPVTETSVSTATETWWFARTMTNYVTTTETYGPETSTVIYPTYTVTNVASVVTVTPELPAMATPAPGMHVKSLNLVWSDTDKEDFDIHIHTSPQDENIGEDMNGDGGDVWVTTWVSNPQTTTLSLGGLFTDFAPPSSPTNDPWYNFPTYWPGSDPNAPLPTFEFNPPLARPPNPDYNDPGSYPDWFDPGFSQPPKSGQIPPGMGPSWIDPGFGRPPAPGFDDPNWPQTLTAPFPDATYWPIPTSLDFTWGPGGNGFPQTADTPAYTGMPSPLDPGLLPPTAVPGPVFPLDQDPILGSYNQGYQNGYSDGYGIGHRDGLAAGYQNGAADAGNQAYDVGYSDGFSDAKKGLQPVLGSLPPSIPTPAPTPGPAGANWPFQTSNIQWYTPASEIPAPTPTDDRNQWVPTTNLIAPGTSSGSIMQGQSGQEVDPSYERARQLKAAHEQQMHQLAPDQSLHLDDDVYNRAVQRQRLTQRSRFGCCDMCGSYDDDCDCDDDDCEDDDDCDCDCDDDDSCDDEDEECRGGCCSFCLGRFCPSCFLRGRSLSKKR